MTSGTKEKSESKLTTYGSALVAIGLSFVIGTMAWKSPVSVCALLAIPLIMNLIGYRWWPFIVAFATAAAGNTDIPGMVGTFFDGSTILGEVLAFVGMTLAQSLPFLIYRPDAPRMERFIRMMLALLIVTIPPFGLVAWKNPLMAAGLFFPGLGYVGIFVMALLYSLLAAGGVSLKREHRWTLGIGLLCLAVFIAGAIRYRDLPTLPFYEGWLSLDTQFDPVDLPGDDHIRGEAVSQLLHYSVVEGIDVVVLPESIFSPMKPVDQVALMPMAYRAEQLGITLLIGSIELDPKNPSRWRNTIQAFGATKGIVDESRSPMPIGNWRPFTGTGVSARPFGSDLIELITPRGARKAAVSICFEDTVIWPHMGLLTGQADVMVSIANVWALTGTEAEVAHDTSATLLSRLAGVPLVRAKNTNTKESN